MKTLLAYIHAFGGSHTVAKQFLIAASRHHRPLFCCKLSWASEQLGKGFQKWLIWVPCFGVPNVKHIGGAWLSEGRLLSPFWKSGQFKTSGLVTSENLGPCLLDSMSWLICDWVCSLVMLLCLEMAFLRSGEQAYAVVMALAALGRWHV